MECKTNGRTYIDKVFTSGCDDASDFIEDTRSELQLGIPKDSRITHHGLSGTAISPAKTISVFISGNSTENPHRVQVSTPLTTINPASDAGLTSFWNSLHGMKPEDEFLKFQVRLSLLPEKLKWLYIREAYVDMFQIIWNNLNSNNETKERFRRMAITGTPGTGESMFLFYILWRLTNMETTKTVTLHRQIERGGIYVFQNNGCWGTFNYSDIVYLLRDTTTWYLTDALEPPPALVNAVTILVSSPAQKYYSNFLTYLPIPPLHYLPVCSLEELKLMAPLYGKDEETVKKRYNMIRGIARYVLEKNEDLEATINTAIKMQLSQKSMTIPSVEGSRENEINHQAVHFEVKPPCYTKYKMVIASEYV